MRVEIDVERLLVRGYWQQSSSIVERLHCFKRTMFKMYTVGHIALGHLVWRLVNREGKMNVLAICLLSMLPDVDLLIPGLRHRGPTHSLIVAFVVFVPVLIIKRRKVLAYFLVLLSHSAVGDYFTGGAQLLWPVSRRWITSPFSVEMNSPLEISLELLLFVISIVVFFRSRDYKRIVDPLIMKAWVYFESK